MKKNGNLMYVIPELRNLIELISSQYGISYSEVQRILVEEHNHLVIKKIRLKEKGKVDLNSLLLIPNKKYVRNVI